MQGEVHQMMHYLIQLKGKKYEHRRHCFYTE